jgi:flagellar biosynthesis/type III secretory pathway ATPase
MVDITDLEHKHHAGQIKEVLATYPESRRSHQYRGLCGWEQSLKSIYAIQMIDSINRFLQQGIDEEMSFEESIEVMKSMMG